MRLEASLSVEDFVINDKVEATASCATPTIPYILAVELWVEHRCDCPSFINLNVVDVDRVETDQHFRRLYRVFVNVWKFRLLCMARLIIAFDDRVDGRPYLQRVSRSWSADKC